MKVEYERFRETFFSYFLGIIFKQGIETVKMSQKGYIDEII